MKTSVHKDARRAKKNKPALLKASRDFFHGQLTNIEAAHINFEKERNHQIPPELRGTMPSVQGRIAHSGSYILRLLNQTGQESTCRFGVVVPNGTGLVVTSHGVVSVSVPDEDSEKVQLWTPVKDTRFFDPEDIGHTAPHQFGRVNVGDKTIQVAAPYAYFSETAQALITSMVSRTIEVVAAEQHAQPGAISSLPAHI